MRVVDIAVKASVAGAIGFLLVTAECLAQGFLLDAPSTATSMPPLALGLSSAGVRAFNDELDEDIRVLNAFGGRSRVDQYNLPGQLVKPRHWTFYGRLGIFNFQDYVNQSRSEGMRFTFRRTGPKLTGRIYIGIHREF